MLASLINNITDAISQWRI